MYDLKFNFLVTDLGILLILIGAILAFLRVRHPAMVVQLVGAAGLAASHFLLPWVFPDVVHGGLVRSRVIGYSVLNSAAMLLFSVGFLWYWTTKRGRENIEA